MFRLLRSALPIFGLFLVASLVRGAGEGQEDLDKATDTKLNARTITDLSEVIRLSEIALDKGLDKTNAAFAKNLLASTLLQRARETTKQILTGSPDDFRQKRQFAISDLEKAVKLDAKQPEVHLMIAQLQLLPEGDAKRASEALDTALGLGLEESADHAKALFLRAGLQKEPDKKLADLNEAVRLAPTDPAPILARGRLLADSDKLEPALADLNKAIELAPGDSSAYETKGLLLAQMKKFDEALVALDKARKLNPDSVMPLLRRSQIHSLQEKYDAALEDINQALSLTPGNVAVLLMRAGVYQEKGDKDKAMADVNRVLTLKPDMPMAIRSHALLLADAKRFDDAIADLEKLRKLAPKDTLTLMQLGVLYNAQKKTDQAIEAYTALLALDPSDWQALRSRGDIHLNAGQQADAIADYERALKLRPKDHGVLNNLAWVLATSTNDKLRDGKRAIELATLACKVTEYKLAYVLSTLAAAYAETGDFDTAVKWSTKAVELNDKTHDDSLRKELESYKKKKPWRESLSEEKTANKSPDKSQPQP